MPIVATGPPKAGRVRRMFRWAILWTTRIFNYASLVMLLSVCAAIPVVQLITLGYLLRVAGRIANGSTVGESLTGITQAGKIGLGVVALYVASIPTQVLSNWQSVAIVVEPASSSGAWLRAGAIVTALGAMFWLMWAWIRGGRLRHYLWPQPIRFLKTAWRPSTWSGAADRLWDFTKSLEVPQLFWLGLRAAAGTLVWLIPAMIVIAANRNGETGLAGLVAAIAIIVLAFAMLYLPMLQINFASENRLRGLFRVGRARDDFKRAPWAWTAAMIGGLLLAPVPLYLLKIEATPREVVWLPCLVFVAFMLPARIGQGLAIRRARRRSAIPTGKWAILSRFVLRLVMLVVVGTYLVFVYVSQYTSWNGLETWIQQHAILVPFPFVGV